MDEFNQVATEPQSDTEQDVSQDQDLSCHLTAITQSMQNRY
jgi:hypothetical protein